MAQTQKPTQKYYVKMAALIEAVNHWIGLDTGSMAAFDETTNALASECGVSGLARAAATMSLQLTNIANDTSRASKVFTAGGAATITGFGVFSAVSSGDMWGWCSFAASQALQTSDQLTCTMDFCFEIGA